jgi:hypothetical protein
MDEGDEAAEDIFEDGLLTIFEDVTVSHGDPGKVFRYRSSNGYVCGCLMLIFNVALLLFTSRIPSRLRSAVSAHPVSRSPLV